MNSAGTAMHSPAPPAPASRDALERVGIPCTDLGNARRLAGVFGDDLIFTNELGWGRWDGRRYAFGTGSQLEALSVGTMLSELLREEARAARIAEVDDLTAQRAIIIERGRREKRFDPHSIEEAKDFVKQDRHAQLWKEAERAENLTRIRGAVELLKTLVRVDFEALERDPWSFVCQNGRIDLAAGLEPVDPLNPNTDFELREAWLAPHDRARLPTKASTVVFDAAATCPEWQLFVDTITSRPDLEADPEMARYLKRCLGWLVFGRNDPPISLLFQGEGSNGKSLLAKTVRKVLGSYAVSVPIEMFLDSGEVKSSAQATPDEVRLPGCRAYFASEPKHGAKLSDAKIKQLAGGEERVSRPNFGDFFEWHPVGTPVLSFNPMPTVVGADHGTTRRLIFVPFRIRLDQLPPDRQREGEEIERAFEGELSGILNWLIEGFHAFKREGLSPPEEARLFKDAMLADTDPVGEFIAAFCDERDDGAPLFLPDFFRVFKLWSEDTAARKIGPQLAKKMMKSRGWTTRPWGGKDRWIGLAWKQSEHVDSYLVRITQPGNNPFAGG